MCRVPVSLPRSSSRRQKRDPERGCRMNAARLITAAALLAGGFSAVTVAQAQQGVTRTDLQQHDLSIPGREAVQVRVDIAPGALAPPHTHFGEEIIYLLEGTMLYEVAGKPVTLKAGDVLF